jgi:hypothetical protein
MQKLLEHVHTSLDDYELTINLSRFTGRMARAFPLWPLDELERLRGNSFGLKCSINRKGASRARRRQYPCQKGYGLDCLAPALLTKISVSNVDMTLYHVSHFERVRKLLETYPCSSV